MTRLIVASGPLLWPQLVVVLAIIALGSINTVRLARGQASQRAKASIDTLPFWGVVAALLGLLGLCAGLFNLLGAVARHANQLGVSPRLVAIGLSECLLTTTLGLLVLLVAALAWMSLGAWWRRLAETGAH